MQLRRIRKGSTILPLLAGGLACLTAACSGPGADTGGAGADTTPAEAEAPPPIPPPDTTAAGLRAHLDAVPLGERPEWYLWPGTGVGDSIPGPHGPRGTLWMNFLARDAITNGAIRLSPGSVLALQELDARGAPAGLLAMYKAPSGWFWANWDAGGAVRAAGRPETCLGCHGEARENILTAPLGTGAIWSPRGGEEEGADSLGAR